MPDTGQDFRIRRLAQSLRVVVWDGPLSMAGDVAYLDARKDLGLQAGRLLAIRARRELVDRLEASGIPRRANYPGTPV